MAVTFYKIGSNLLVPGVYTELDPSNATSGVSIQDHISLIVAQKTSAGSASAGLYRVESVDQVKVLAGTDSQAAAMVAAYRKIDRETELWVYLFDDAAGTELAGSIDFAGAATESGSIVMYIGGRRIVVGVDDTDTAADVEAAALLALAAQADDDFPAAYSASAGTGVDFTAIHQGSSALDVRLGVCLMEGERVPAGLAAVATQMAGTPADVNYDDLVTAMADKQFHTVASGLSIKTELDKLVAEMVSREDPDRAIPGMVFAVTQGSAGTLTTYGNLLNSHRSCTAGVELSALRPPAYEIAAAIAAKRAKKYQSHPGIPFTNDDLAMVGVEVGARFVKAQQRIILSDGVSTVDTDRTGALKIQRLVTNYQTNSLGSPDTAYQDVTTVGLLDAIDYAFRAGVSAKFSQSLLADDVDSDGNPNTFPPGVPVATPATVKAELISIAEDLQTLGWIENVGVFASTVVVARNISNPNRIDAVIPPDTINALLITAIRNAFKR